MRFQKFSFSSIRIDGTIYEHDVVIDGGHLPTAKVIEALKKEPDKTNNAIVHVTC